MKGMLVKDFRLLKSQRITILFIFGIAVGISLAGNNSAFILGFIPFVMTMFTISTVAYDEFENGNAFLFTLPISRSLYVKEKYVFSLILGMGSLLIATILTVVFEGIRGNSLKTVCITSIFILAAILFFQSIIIPFQLKFGGEKSRIAMVAAFGFITLVGMLGIKILKAFGINTLRIYSRIESLSLGMMVFSIIILAVVMSFISLKISIKIMNKKEF